MLLKYCKCGKLISQGQRYCEACEKVENERAEKRKHENQKIYNKRRDKDSLVFYRSKAWRMLSRRRLAAANYICEVCGENVAVDVHHIEPVRKNKARSLDYDNLIAVCERCHKRVEGRNIEGRG